MTVLAADRFETYGPSHQGALVLLLVGVVAIVLFGRRHRGTELAVRWGRIMAAAVLAVTIPLQVLYFTPSTGTSTRRCRCSCATSPPASRCTRCGRVDGGPRP